MSISLKSLLLIQLQYWFRLQVLVAMHAYQVRHVTRFPQHFGLLLLLHAHVHVKVMSSQTTVSAVRIKLFTNRVYYRASYPVFKYSTETGSI